MSYGGNADPTGIQVTFLDQTGAKSVKAVIAFSVPVSRILPNIITKMNLPATSPDGQPMSYSLDHKEGGRRLLESQTLVECGVQNGDHLLRTPVTTGVENAEHVEITDGIYVGDVVATHPVETLYLIELRATKGGGHSH